MRQPIPTIVYCPWKLQLQQGDNGTEKLVQFFGGNHTTFRYMEECVCEREREKHTHTHTHTERESELSYEQGQKAMEQH